jgi:hypothetical protein
MANHHPRTARSINPIMATAAFVGLIALVGLIGFVLAQRGNGPEGRASGTATPSDTASEAPAPSETATAIASVAVEPSNAIGLPVLIWEQPEAFHGQPADVMVDGDTWVTVGWATERGPAAWTSSDARTWERSEVVDPVPDDMFTGSGLGPTIRLGDSLLSYGTFIGCCDGRGVLGWRSADGRSWEVIESDSPLFETGYLVTGLALGDPALVAIESRYAPFSGRIWSWTEATSWVETTPGVGSGMPSGMEVADVVWGEDRFVAVGSRSDPSTFDGPVTGTSWTSTDGQMWEESAPGPELADVALFQVTPLPGEGFFALGMSAAANSGNGGVPLAYTSQDGLSWTPAGAPPALPNTRPSEILAIEGGVIAIGSDGSETVAWTSPDGQSWTDAGRIDHAFVAAAVHDEQLVVFTVYYEDGGSFQINRATIDFN